MVHLRDSVEAPEVIDVQKLFNFCNKYLQFYVLSKYLYDIICFFELIKQRDRNNNISNYKAFVYSKRQNLRQY